MIYYDFVREISFFCKGVTAIPNSETGNNFSSPKRGRWRQFGKSQRTSSSRIFGGGGGGGGGCAVAIQFQFVYQTFPPPPRSAREFDGEKKLFSFFVLGKKVSVFLAFFRVSCRLGSGVWFGSLASKAVFASGVCRCILCVVRKGPRGKTGKLR